MPSGCLRPCVALLVSTLVLPAQQAKAELSAEQRASLVASLQRLDMGHTDWVLLQDVGEKAKALGAGAIPVVAAEAGSAGDRAEGRYRIRLLGVLARIDPEQGTAKLAEVIAGDNQGLAAIAARVLGRSGAAADRIAAAVTACMAQETRPGVAGALALAAGDAGATAGSKLLRERLTSGKLDDTARVWWSMALAQVAGPDLQAEAVNWLKGDSPLLPAGILLVRRARDAKAEQALLALFAMATGDLAEWIANSLGVCGGDAARKALRAALTNEAKEQAAAGVTVTEGQHDPRLLALVRLGEAKAVAWSKAAVAAHGEAKPPGRVGVSMMSPSIARLPELLGKWNVAGAAEVLLACTRSTTTPCWMRAYAARGLCWRRDVRGLEAAAAILAAKEHGEHEFGVPEGLAAAEETLHQFVANVDRPDYVPIDRDEEDKAIPVGEQWQQWLAKHIGKVTWREPAQDANELLFWY